MVTQQTIRQTLKKEPPVLIMQDALPLFKLRTDSASLTPKGDFTDTASPR